MALGQVKSGMPFSELETNILKAKGVGGVELERLAAAGVGSRDDFRTVGDAATLSEISGLSPELAARVMTWALGTAQPTASTPSIVVQAGDAVLCVHCQTRQPKDYRSGDLCGNCGKQAEPILSCFWCSATGPGRFCRQCAAEFVPTGELELALLLKREGYPKDQIPAKLAAMTSAEKDVLWGRVRKARG
jgi:hypothetical protein